LATVLSFVFLFGYCIVLEGRNTSNEVCLIVKYCCGLRPVV
jgi:hypothetical protein